MRDSVATIQAEQDEILRLNHPEVLVIEGGPGRMGANMVRRPRVTGSTVTELLELLESGDAVVDGGNSAYRDDIDRTQVAASRGSTMSTAAPAAACGAWRPGTA